MMDAVEARSIRTNGQSGVRVMGGQSGVTNGMNVLILIVRV